MGASTPHRKAVRMWPNSSCSICLVSALMWIGRVVVLQPEKLKTMLTRKARTHSRDNLTSNPSLRAHCRRSPGTTSGAVGTSTRADACALQAYAQAPSALSAFITIFLVLGAWHFGLVVNRRTHSARCIVTSKSIFANATATGTNQQSRPQVH